MIKKGCLILCLIFGAHRLLHAQELLKVEGVISNENYVPLPNVSLRIKAQMSSATNSEGEFILKFPQTLNKDTLSISCVGFQTLKVPLATVKGKLRLILKSETVNLAEVAIYSGTPQSIVKKAIQNIPANYAQDPFELVGFYREIAKIDAGYLSFAEASLNILMKGYNHQKNKDFIIVNKERNLKKVGDEVVSNPFKASLNGVPFVILENDLIQNPGAILGEHYLSRYDYEITGSSSINGEEAFIITFDQKDNISEALYKGTIVIIKSSYAIASIDFSLSPKGKQYIGSDVPFVLRPLMRLMGYSFQKLNEQLSCRYAKIKNKWYPQFYSISTTHHVKARKQHIDGNLQLSGELFISNVNMKPLKKYDPANRMPRDYSFNKNAVDYSDDYWGDYNFIKPTTALKKIAETMK